MNESIQLHLFDNCHLQWGPFDGRVIPVPSPAPNRLLLEHNGHSVAYDRIGHSNQFEFDPHA